MDEFLNYETEISIHAPLVGGDFRKFQVSQYQKISIHAPLVGGD